MNRKRHTRFRRLAAASTLTAVGALTTLMPVRLGAAEIQEPQPHSEAAPPRTESIEALREALAQNPDDAEQHLALARALGAAIEADAANGPRYAFEMRTALERAIELDPELVEAYHWLVGYYLNAPPIAGGSIEAAEATARRLEALDREAGQALLEHIATRRSAQPAGRE